ncbi:hypothetical protein ARHIZOSPH14_20650 [Agromyces rhizosphaerae]|uniref:DUF1353 domain-containing protein n=1 Tax=Agromyces rhizosphaerae TaxID=88374 RepID=A0A9W6CSS1_9MICO|nr:DUF1353 domain-containing protein [Agromyces rhizosphaerae]GLI27823.1 hypothetical protein ARHIZOSPH14_20650 [Agromyces rhizosphaerae]
MPFSDDEGGPLERIVLAQRPADGYEFDVLEPIRYDDPVDGGAYRAQPAATDLASVPPFLWSFIASYGRQSAPAVLHDAQSRAADELGDRGAVLAQRRVDDRVFRTALLEQGVPLLRAWLMWSWVSADRTIRYSAAGLGVLLVLQTVVGAALVVAATVLAFAQPWWLLLALVPAVLALPWGAERRLMVWLPYSVAAFGPLVLLHLVALVPFRLVEAIVALVSGGRPADVVRPTVRG